MTCPVETLDSWSAADFLKQFRGKVLEQRIPIYGSLELTRRCNLACVHCYLGCNFKGAAVGEELGTDSVCSILRAAANAGCLSMVLTGGEPLLREDFPALYRCSKEQGMLTIVFTNATRIDDRVIALFKELPPRGVEVSVYGATRETYERVTGVPGSYDACRRGLDLLAENGIALRLKTMLMTINRHELSALRKLADGYGALFHFDAALFPRLDGERGPLAYRVSPGEAAAADFSDPDRAEGWVQMSDRNRPDTRSERLFHCGAGRTGFHVTASGRMQPCLLTTWIGRDLRGEPFPEAWESLRLETGALRMEAAAVCRSCERKNLCGYCPAFFRLETGRETVYSPFCCEVGHEREQRIKEWCRRERDDGFVEATEAARAV